MSGAASAQPKQQAQAQGSEAQPQAAAGEQDVTYITPSQYYHTREVKARLKHEEELRYHSGPEAPHSYRLAAEAARQRGLGQVDKEEKQKSPRQALTGDWTNKLVASARQEPEEGKS